MEESKQVAAIVMGIVGVVILSMLLDALRCKHAWELIDKFELPPKLEEMRKAGATFNFYSSQDLKEFCSRTIIFAIRCGKCGRAKIYRERS